LFETHRAGSML